MRTSMRCPHRIWPWLRVGLFRGKKARFHGAKGLQLCIEALIVIFSRPAKTES